MGAGASSQSQRIDKYASDSEATAAAHIAKGGSLYAVAVGHTPGVYTTWAECQQQVAHYPRGTFRSFTGEHALKTAKAFVEEHAKPAEFGLTWVGHEYLKLDANAEPMKAVALGSDGDAHVAPEDDEEPVEKEMMAPYDFDFELYSLSTNEYKQLVYEEIELYHSEEAVNSYLKNRQDHPNGILF